MLDVGSLLISVARSVPLCLGHPVGSIPGWRSAETRPRGQHSCESFGRQCAASPESLGLEYLGHPVAQRCGYAVALDQRWGVPLSVSMLSRPTN
jgi:hypothetical protein